MTIVSLSKAVVLKLARSGGTKHPRGPLKSSNKGLEGVSRSEAEIQSKDAVELDRGSARRCQVRCKNCLRSYIPSRQSNMKTIQPTSINPILASRVRYFPFLREASLGSSIRKEAHDGGIFPVNLISGHGQGCW